MNGFCRRRDTQESRRHIERHAEDSRWHGAPAELIKFMSGWYREDSDDGTFVRGSREDSASIIQSDAGQGRAVGFNDIDGFEFEGVEEQDITTCRRNVASTGWRVGRRYQRRWGCFLRQRVGQIAIFGRRGEGAYG